MQYIHGPEMHCIRNISLHLFVLEAPTCHVTTDWEVVLANVISQFMSHALELCRAVNKQLASLLLAVRLHLMT